MVLFQSKTQGIRAMARFTFLLGAGLITAALAIGTISYHYSFRMMESSYQTFYLNKALMITRSVEPSYEKGDRELLNVIDRFWESARTRPPDEYICVVDKDGNLLLHTASPETVGLYAGDNLILGNSGDTQGKLCDLVNAQKDYVGQYISSTGDDQIAAFVPVPGRNWTLGVHRSRKALRQEIKDGFLPLIAGFLVICGLLMPVTLFSVYKNYSNTHLRQLRSQQALEESEQDLAHTMAQLQTVLQSVPSGIIAVNERQELTMVNQKASELLELVPGEAIGRSISEVIPNTEIGRVMTGGTVEFGKPWQFKGRKLLVSRSPIYEEERVVGGVSVFHDESELEAVQRRLEETRQLNAEFTTLIENLHDGVLITSDDRVIRVNPAFGRISGIPSSSLEGRPLDELDQERHPFLHLIRATHQQVRRLTSSVTLRRTLEGGKDVFITGRPVLDGAGQVSRVVMSVCDFTELHSLEKKIEQLSISTPRFLWEEGPGEGHPGIVAESPKTRTLLDLCARVAKVDSTVLLRGESGVGKDLLARFIYRWSRRREHPFVSINCGAIPESLLESELFGYERGAFSGASREGKIGLFEEAEGGVVFLDEVGELPLALQVKLLTVLQEQRFRRLGSVKDQVTDVRIIAATNRNLEEMVAKGSFRGDLYYRLFVVPIEVPPLRERREDIMPLALQYLQGFNRKYGVSRMFGPEVLPVMESYEWPGNVRELQNVVERMVVTGGSDVLTPEHLPRSIYQAKPASCAEPGLDVPLATTLREARDMLEKRLVGEALRNSRNTREAAKLLGVTHPTIVRKAQKYGIRVDSGTPENKLH